MCWIRTKVSILCLRNTIMALRGSRTLKSEADVESPDDFGAERDVTDLELPFLRRKIILKWFILNIFQKKSKKIILSYL